ncbi:MAG: tetratricopeptide repeat protein, partial [Candidatus Acidiferrales bacterium]
MNKLRHWLLVFLSLSGLYLYAWPAATLFYAGIVLLHLVAGVFFAFVSIPWLRKQFSSGSWGLRWGGALLGLGAILGIVLAFTGTLRPMQPWLYAHIAASVVGLILIGAELLSARGWLGSSRAACGAALVLLVATLAVGSWGLREIYWQRAHVIENPLMPPATPDGEGDGPQGPFFPSSAQTKHGGLIPARFFMESQACQRCHPAIYEQWSSSAHRFSSFNNQWYRKSVEYMQDVAGVKASKWCGGCHDPALLFSGMMDTPIKEIIDRPESHAGLGCVMCHSIVEVKSSMGQGDFVLEYPLLHDLATSENPLVRRLHDFAVRLNPEPHRRTFLKPFVRRQTAEFCSSCHKVHLDIPVNHYRWFRGFNEYDNWQASGVSGQGARSFYYPTKSQKCVDCHMPLVPATDDGNVKGFVHSHRFPAANTALPVANQDAAQLEVTEKFLRDNIVSVDIFAISPALPVEAGGPAHQRELATTFAVGEEAESMLAPGQVREVAPLTAPLDRADAVVRRGETVRVDVVVRTRKLGHFFPGGTVDAFDVWLELKATDEKGQVLFWSGMVEDEGKGPVEKGAHFYRSLLVDAHGNPINKRNAWSARALVYVRLIPPGAADTVHYRLRVPENAGERIDLEARLHYRKFSWWNTHFSFAGVRDPAEPEPEVSPDYDDGRWVFTGDTSRVSGKVKQVPDLPVITIAEDRASLRVAGRGAPTPEPRAVVQKDDWERWNDYGIGLLLQGDLKGAEAAFLRATEADPTHPDGWVNVGRARVQEGNLDGAREVLERALKLSPDLARAHFFYARVLRNEGKYAEALEHLRRVIAQFPRDRVVRNDIGRILFLERRYAEAVEEFKRTLAIDPEDLQAHYNLML